MEKNRETVDWRLIRKKIDGALSEEEENRLIRWVEGDARRLRFIRNAEKYYSRQDMPAPDESRTADAWSRVKEGCEKADCRRRRRRIYAWAAAAAVVVLVGYMRLFYPAEFLSPSFTTGAAIAPGCPKACLILSDGSVKNLDTRMYEKQLSDTLVHIQLNGNSIRYKAQQKEGREVFNTLRIPRGGEYSVVLSDGTKVWLNAQSELTYPVAFRGEQRRVMLKGEAYFEVARDTLRPFMVETGQVGIKVLGTSFNVNAYEDETDVVTTLVSGKVQLWEGGKAVGALRPCQQARYSKADGSTRIYSVKTDMYTQWRESWFVFRNETLTDIMKVLARWYDMEYDFLAPELERERFYGKINRYDRVQVLLEQFEKTGKVRFELDGKKVHVVK